MVQLQKHEKLLLTAKTLWKLKSVWFYHVLIFPLFIKQETVICVCYNLESFNSIIKSTLKINNNWSKSSVAIIVFVNSSIDSINDLNDVKKVKII